MKTLSILLFISFAYISAYAEQPQIDDKILRYHSVLIKNPASNPIFQRFQAAWLTKNNEESLLAFLEQKAEQGNAADIQILANYFLQKGQNQQAITTFNKSIGKNPKNPHAFLARAQCYARVFNFEKAIGDIDQALKVTDDTELILTANKNKGRYLLRSGETQKAVTHWQKLAGEYKQDEELLEDVIDIQLNDGLLEPALKLALTLRNNTTEPYKRAIRTLRIGDIQKRNGQVTEATETYLTALAVSGSGSWLEREVIAQLEKLYRAGDNTTGLISTFEKLTLKYPQRISIHQKYADLLSIEGEFESAKKTYQNLLKTNPQNLSIRIAYLQVLKKSDDYQTAQKILDFLIEKNPNDLQLLLQKVTICHEIGDRDSLLETIKIYKTKAKPSPAISLKYAKLLQKYNFPEQALEAYRESVKNHPDTLENYFVTADYLTLNGRKEEALKLWEEIATKADHISLVRLLDILLINDKAPLAAQIVDNQFPKFKTKPSFIRLAAVVAQANKQPEKAISYARNLLLVSKRASELDRSLTLCIDLITKAGAQTDILLELQNKQTLGNPEICLLIELLEFNGDIKETDKHLTALTATKEPIALLQAARIYERRFQLDKAAQALEQLVNLPNGGKTPFLRKLTFLYERSGDLAKSQETITKWKTLTPNDKLAWITEADFLEQQQGPEAALLAFRRGIYRFNDEPEMLGRLASLYSRASRHLEAISLYWKLYDSVEKLSERIRWASMLATEAHTDGSSETLIDEFNSRRRKSPTAIAPIMALAEVYRILNNYEQRRDLLLEATRLRPEDPTILLEIASGDQRQGEVRQAIEMLQKAKAFDKTGNASRQIARLHMEEGDIEQGLLELTELQKNDPRGIENITLTLFRQQAYEEAQAFLSQHLANHPDDWRLSFLSALADYEVGYNSTSFKKTLALLKVEAPISNLQSGWELKDLSSQRLPFGMDSLPEHIRLLLNSQSAQRLLDSITRSNSSSYSSGYGLSSSGISSSLPKEPGAMRVFARLHLLRLLGESSRDEFEIWSNRAKQTGFKNLTLWGKFHEAQYPNEEFKQYILDEFRKDQTKSNLLLLYITVVLTEGDFTLPDDILHAANKFFKSNNKHPFFKEIVHFFASENTDLNEHIKKINAKNAKSEKLSFVQIIGTFLINQEKIEPLFDESGDNTDIDSNLIKILTQYSQQNPVTSKQINLFTSSTRFEEQFRFISAMVVSNIILGSGDVPKIIQEIEADKIISSRNLFSQRGSGRHNTLTFPPLLLTNLTGSSVSHFSEKSKTFTPDKLEPHTDKISSPLLKAIALHYTKQTDQSLTILKNLQEKPDLLADALIIKASIFNAKKEADIPAVIEALEKARTASMDRNQRINLDRLILSTSLKNIPDNKFSEEIFKMAKASARRLMISKKITNVEEIESTLTALGMEHEKARFLTSNRKSIHNLKSAVGGIIGKTGNHSSRTTSRNSLNKKVEIALKQKNTQRACRLLIQEAKQHLSGLTRSRWKIKEVEETISKYKLQKQVIKELNPRSSLSPRRWLMYYQMAKLLKDEEAAETAIIFLKNLPNPPASVRGAVGLAIYEREPERALKLFKSSRNISQVFDHIRSQLNESDQDPEECISLMELAGSLLASLDETDFRRDRNTGRSAESLVDRLLHTNRYSFSKTLDYWETPQKPDSNVKIIQRRDKAITKYLITILNKLPHQVTAFQALHARKSFRKENLNDLIPLAKSTLTLSARSDLYARSFSYGQNSEIYEQSPSPVNFLISISYTTNNPSVISDEFIAKVKKSNEGNDFNLTNFKELIFLPDADFSKWINSSDVKNNLVETIVTRQTLADIRKPKEQIEFAKTVLKLISNKDNFVDIQDNTEVLSNSQYTGIYSESLRKNILIVARHEPEELKKCLNALVSMIPEDVRADTSMWFNSFFTRKYSNFPEIQPEQIIISIADLTITVPSTQGFVIPFFNKYNIPLSYIKIYRNTYNDDSIKIDSDIFIKSLKKSGLLSSFDKMPFLKLKEIDSSKIKLDSNYQRIFSSLQDEEDKKSVEYGIEIFTSYLAGKKSYTSDSLVIKEVSNFLIKQKSFGSNLLATLIEDTNTSTLKFLKKYKAEIANASRQRKNALADILNISSNKKISILLKSNDLDNLFPDFNKNNAKEMEEDIQAFLNIKPGTKIENDYNLPTQVILLIQSIIDEDLALAAKITLHYIALVEALPANQVGYYSLDSTSRYHMNVAQVALNSRLIHSLAKSISVHQFNRLLYLLSLSPRSSELNLIYALDHNTLKNVINKNVTNKDFKSLKPNIQKIANQINNLSTQDEKNFHILAWHANIASSNAFDGAVKERHFRKSVNELIKENPKNVFVYKHFILGLDITLFYGNAWKKPWLRSEYVPEIAQERRRSLRVTKSINQFASTISEQHKRLLFNQLGRKRHLFSAENKALYETIVQNLEDAAQDPSLAISSDLRYIIWYMAIYPFPLSDEQNQRRAKIGFRLLQNQIDQIKLGKTIHQYFIISTCMLAACTPEGTAQLETIVASNNNTFAGIIPIAMLLTREGHIDTAAKLIQSSKNGNLQKNQKQVAFDRNLEKHFPQLLDKIQDPVVKLHTAYHILKSEDTKDLSKKPNQLHHERLLELAKILKNTTVPIPDPLREKIYDIFMESRSLLLLPYLKKKLEEEPFRGDVDHILAEYSANEYPLTATLQMQLKLILSEDPKKYLRILNNTLQRFHNEPKSIKLIERLVIILCNEMNYYCIELLHLGDHDELKKCLPVLDKCLQIIANNGKIPGVKKHHKNRWSLPSNLHHTAWLIYNDLGMLEKYHKLMASLPEAQKKNLLSRRPDQVNRINSTYEVFCAYSIGDLKRNNRKSSPIMLASYMNKTWNTPFLQNKALKLPTAKGMLHTLVTEKIITPEEGIEIYKHTEITPSSKQFELKILADKIMLNANAENRDKTLILLDEFVPLLKKQKFSPQKVVSYELLAANCYLLFGEKEKAASVMTPGYEKKLKSGLLQNYKDMLKRLKK